MTGTFLYDGDCAFCTRAGLFLRRHVPTAARIVAWQATDLVPLGVTRQQCAAAVQWVDDNGVVAGPVAIAALLHTAAGPRGLAWRVLGRLLGLRPVLWLAWPVYRLVARNRHRLPGGSAACELPRHVRA